jgi:O-antigen/teichoic acid export membrane protein
MFLKDRIGEFGKVLIRFASAQLISNGLRMLSGFMVVRLLSPADFGLFTGIGIYLGYILLGHFGVINGLGRELPYELARKNDEEAKALAYSAFGLTVILSIIASLTFLILGLFHWWKGEVLIGTIYCSYSVWAFFHLLNAQFLPVLYRTNNDFNALAKQNIYYGFGNLFTVLFVYFFGIYGLMIRSVFLAIYQFLLLYKNKPFGLKLQLNLSHIRRLFKTGIPIFLVGQVSMLWETIMNSILFSIGGAISYGLYSLSYIVQGAIGIIPVAFSNVIYPRMTIMFGEGLAPYEIIKRNLKPLFFQLFFMLGIAIIGYFSLPTVISYVLPKYIGGVKAAQWTMFIPVVQSFSSILNIYNVIKKQGFYLFSLVTGAAIGCSYVFIRLNTGVFSLEFFPQGILIGTIIQQALSLMFLRFIIKK